MRDGHSGSLRYLKVLRARRRDRFAMCGGTEQGFGRGAGGWLAAGVCVKKEEIRRFDSCPREGSSAVMNVREDFARFRDSQLRVACRACVGRMGFEVRRYETLGNEL
jgi:hypothetical protein